MRQKKKNVKRPSHFPLQCYRKMPLTTISELLVFSQNPWIDCDLLRLINNMQLDIHM